MSEDGVFTHRRGSAPRRGVGAALAGVVEAIQSGHDGFAGRSHPTD